MIIYKKFVFLISVFLTFTLLYGCASKTEPKPSVTIPLQLKTEKQKVDPIKEQIESMTLDEKIGQMLIVGFDGLSYNDHIKEMIEQYHIGGFILFKRNIKNSQQTLTLINSIKNANSNKNIPLFLSVDEEGGLITRMPKELKNIPNSKKIGQVSNKDFSYELGRSLGLKLHSFGFNMNFAPVLDINSNPKNPVIGIRSFGSNEEIVSALGISTMKGIQSQNVISVVKHFPGHGDTSIDSHLKLPTVNHDLKRLNNFELIPFKNAIYNDADAVMVAHILFPKMDPNHPATLSKRIVTDLLRKDLDFKGVVITDDFEMGAIIKNYPIEEASLKSVNAGCDLLLVCHTREKQISVIHTIKKAVLNHEIDENRIDESVYRILKLKEKYHLSNEIIQNVDVKSINHQIHTVLNKYLPR